MLRERMSENQRRLGDLTGGGDLNNEAAANQMLEDEKFAIMLQNEEFMAELRGNREFLSALEEEAAGADHFYHQHQQSQPPPQQQQVLQQAAKKGGGGGGGGGALGMDDAMFREKLKNMGKQSKQTFRLVWLITGTVGTVAGRSRWPGLRIQSIFDRSRKSAFKTGSGSCQLINLHNFFVSLRFLPIFL